MGRKAPWTDREVEAMRWWQSNGAVHPLTCPDHAGQPLNVAADALTCPLCDWRQTWVPTVVAHRED